MLQRTLAVLVSLSVALGLLGTWRSPALAVETTRTGAVVARPSTTGQLRVEGTQLVDAEGNPAVVRGVSTHGLQWFPQYVNDSLFAELSEEWGANLVRLALYSEQYCEGDAEGAGEALYRGIDACIANDLYVLVDWHILNDNNPNDNLEKAQAFFGEVSAHYAGVPNLIYEICNEPNGETTWSDVYDYAQQVIPVIRANSPQAVIVVGTTNYDRELTMAARKPLDFDNVMYTVHFYTATHGEDLRGEVVAALDMGLPIFVTECGLSEASGDGRVDFEQAVEWFKLVDQYHLSYAIWSLSNKAETSAFIKPHVKATDYLKDSQLTPVGLWAKALLQGQDPATIPVPEVDDEGYLKSDAPDWLSWLTGDAIRSASAWPLIALGVAVLVGVSGVLWRVYRRSASTRHHTYDDLVGAQSQAPTRRRIVYQVVIVISTFFTLVYLVWRVLYSVPLEAGWISVAACLVLLAVEVLGFVESLILYESLVGIREHPLPVIADDEYPDVDIFISTYNEPCDLLRRTINGCKHLLYPDKSKVHVWVCDDGHRAEMRELAEAMGVGYFDRPDHKGQKAGNLNSCLSRTSAPYVVTLDADMIVRREFLLKTIPYFVDAEKRNASLPDDQKIKLGIIQTPQCFYDPDVFQHALYAETRAPNEQDFFYRTIEVAKTSTNSVIYGGSNTVIAREALEAAGGFYTESITEDFATGMLIESAGYVSLGLAEPLASGRTPHTYREHIQQRTRWGRGVIVTARKLHLLTRGGLSLAQRMSYWSSVVYWYSPLKHLVYVASPLLFAVLGLPVFECSWLDLLVYWLPMFAAQTICLRVVSSNAISTKWSGIYETSVMPHLLVPIVKEALGITLSTFKVTDKSGKGGRRTMDRRALAPFAVLLALSAIGVVRVLWLVVQTRSVGLAVLLFWLIRNAYYLAMAVFLVDGRDSDSDPVRVVDTMPIVVKRANDDGSLTDFEGVTTQLNEHSMRVFLDEADDLRLGDRVGVVVDDGVYRAEMYGVVSGAMQTQSGKTTIHAIEILDMEEADELEYLQLLYDRIPSLPQALTHDYSVLGHLWRNIAFRVARTVR